MTAILRSISSVTKPTKLQLSDSFCLYSAFMYKYVQAIRKGITYIHTSLKKFKLFSLEAVAEESETLALSAKGAYLWIFFQKQKPCQGVAKKAYRDLPSPAAISLAPDTE